MDFDSLLVQCLDFLYHFHLRIIPSLFLQGEAYSYLHLLGYFYDIIVVFVFVGILAFVFEYLFLIHCF